MAVTLDQKEIDEFLASGHTIIISTVGRDGYPHAIPSWYCYLDGVIYVRGRAKAQRTKNLLRDPKVCVLVEWGKMWAELRGVMVRGRAELVEDEPTIQRITDALTAKYLPFRTAREKMPERSQAHYASASAHFRIIPEKKLATWDNSKLRLKG